MPTSHDTPSEIVADLTLDQKIGQLTGTYYGIGGGDTEPTINDEEDVTDMVRDYGIGHISPISSAIESNPNKIREVIREIQRTSIEETDHGIPVMFTLDAIHGNAYLEQTTVFPHNLAVAASFNPDLAKRAAETTSHETQVTGGHQNYSPTCDVMREPRWGRCYETFGESPHLNAEMVESKIQGYQETNTTTKSQGLIATAKHFPAYSQNSRGEDAAPNSIDNYTIQRVFLPVFRKAIEAGVNSVMPCYNSIDGEPVHGSQRYLNRLLRDQLGFKGFVVTDWTGTRMLHTHHKTTNNLKESVKKSIEAGIDVFSIGGVDHIEALRELVEAGEIPVTRIDKSVKRVLEAKMEIGLFENPYPDTESLDGDLQREKDIETSKQASRESIVLLENNDALPLDPTEIDDVLVVGPNADNRWHQMGGWSVMNHGTSRGETIVDALNERLDAEVHYIQCSTLDGLDNDELDEAVELADRCDAAIAVMGEGFYIHEFGPSILQSVNDTGRFPTRTELELPRAQREVISTLHNKITPLILVMIAGRPVTFNPNHTDAAFWCCYPGMHGGPAVVDAIFGGFNPSGKLPFSYPRDTAQLPQRYNYLRHPHPIGDDDHSPSYDPLYRFGHGLSYTEIEYLELDVEEEVIDGDGVVDLFVNLRNSGDEPKSESVLVFANKEVSSRVTPKRELVGFEKMDLAPGEEIKLDLDIDMRRVSRFLLGTDEPAPTGNYNVFVGDLEESFIVE